MQVNESWNALDNRVNRSSFTANCQTKKKLFTQLKARVKGIRLVTPGGSVVQQMVETVTVAELNAVNKMLLKK